MCNSDSQRVSAATDFGIRLVSAVGGAIRLNDELKFRFDVLARRKPEASDDG